jgi:hypothetical protein
MSSHETVNAETTTTSDEDEPNPFLDSTPVFPLSDYLKETVSEKEKTDHGQEFHGSYCS